MFFNTILFLSCSVPRISVTAFNHGLFPHSINMILQTHKNPFSSILMEETEEPLRGRWLLWSTSQVKNTSDGNQWKCARSWTHEDTSPSTDTLFS